MPLLADYEREIEKWLFDELDLRAEFTGLRGGWTGLSPVIYADRFEIFSEQENTAPVFSASQITVSIAMSSSLMATELRLGKIKAENVSVQLEEYAPKRWRMSGLPVREDDISADIFLDNLLSVRQVELFNLSAYLAPYQQEPLKIKTQIFELANSRGFHRLKTRLGGDNPGSAMEFIIETRGDPRFIDTFTGKAYAKLEQVNLDKFRPLAEALGFDPKGMVVSTELWGSWQEGGLMNLQGSASIPGLDIAKFSNKPYQPINKARAEFLLEVTDRDNWSLRFEKLDFEWYEHVWLFDQLMVSQQSLEGVKRLYFATDDLDLDPMSSFLGSSDLLDERLLGIVTTLDPHGKLVNFHLDFPIDSPADFSLSAYLDNVSVKPWKGAPGGSGISGGLVMNRHDGQLLLEADDFSLSFPKIYKHDLNYTQAVGSVFWQFDSQGVQVFSDEIQLRDEVSSAAGGFWLDIPAAGSEAMPSLTLNIGLQDSRVQQKDKYLPTILSPGLLSWLDSALSEGRIIEGGFYYHGTLKKGGPGSRSVQLFFDVRDADLQYQANWPALEQVDGLVMVDDEEVRVTVSKAKVYDSMVSEALVTVAPLQAGQEPRLHVQASIEGPANDGLSVLRESPLRTQIGKSFDDWHATGSSNTRFTLDMLLYNKSQNEKPSIVVDVELAGNDLDIKPLNLLFNGVTGELHFDSQHGLYSDQLTAALWQRPVIVSIGQQTGTWSNDKTTVVSLSGSAGMDSIRQWTQQPLLEFAQGDANFEAALRIIDNDDFLLQITSDLVGVKSDMPEPLFKESQTPLPFKMSYAGGTKHSLLNMSFGDAANSTLILHERELIAGSLQVGSQPAVLPLDNQFVISGRAARASSDDWQSWLAKYKQAANVEGGTDESDAVALIINDLRIDHLTVADYHFENSMLNLWSEPGQIKLQLENSIVSGELSVPDKDSGIYTADLSYIHMDHFIGGSKSEAIQVASSAVEQAKGSMAKKMEGSQTVNAEGSLSGTAEGSLSSTAEDSLSSTAEGSLPQKAKSPLFESINEVDFSSWPKLQLSADQVFKNGDLYGSLAFKVIPAGDTLILEDLNADIKGVQISGSKGQAGATLKWQRNNEVNVTSFNGLLTAGDLAEVLPQWGYEGGLNSEKATMQLAVQWPGSPAEMNAGAFDGNMEIKLKKGRFLSVSKSASGALRIVGALNISELLRRLTLDFSDIYKKGLTYDSIAGSFDLEKGVLTTHKPLEMKSPSSRFEFIGVIDVPQNRLDMEMTATLPVSKNLPWIAAIAGGLPVAAGVYVANKIFEDQIDRFSSAVYEIKGTLDEPEIKFKRVFEKKSDKKSRKKANKKSQDSGDNRAVTREG